MMWGGFAFLWVALFWVGVILLVVWAIRSNDGGRTPGRRNRALEILEERYARGEIDAEEFDARRRDLGG